MLPPCDLAIAGAGPAGLSAAIQAASEGLRVTCLEPLQIGGQAHWSAAIENLAGFPDGISGKDLAARMLAQAQKFGVRFFQDALFTFCPDPPNVIMQTSGGRILDCRALILATGLSPRPLDLPGADSFGVFAIANPDELPRYGGKRIAIIGGGNSAGQAAVAFLHVRASVTLFTRRALALTMSSYLIDRIVPNATIKENVIIPAIESNKLEVSILGETFDAIFSFIGARPCHRFPLGPKNDYIAADETLATTTPGVFVVGDLRASNTTKRIASALGDGAQAVNSVHAYLKGQL